MSSTLTAPKRPLPLPPPPQFDIGSIVTLRMRGHSRTNGQDYYAPAVVLNQYMPGGELEVLIWDSSAGTHYQASYPVRDISTRGDGDMREMFVLQENVQNVLFSPALFSQMASDIGDLQAANITLQTQLLELSNKIDKLAGVCGRTAVDAVSKPNEKK